MGDATFSWRGVARGLLDGLAFGVSSTVYGLGFGVVAAAAGLTILEASVMSALVFSGTAQFGVVQAWGAGLSPVAAFVTVLVTNVRYLLMGASMRPWLGALKARMTAPALLLLVDGSFARAMAGRAQGQTDVGILLGTSIVSWAGWIIGTVGGYGVVTVVANPKRLGLDFVVVAFCASALALLVKNKSDLVPVGVALVAAVLFERVAGGSWPVVAAAVAAAIVGYLRHGPELGPELGPDHGSAAPSADVGDRA